MYKSKETFSLDSKEAMQFMLFVLVAFLILISCNGLESVPTKFITPKPGQEFSISSVEDFTSKVFQENKNVTYENSWLCLNNTCFSFGQPTPYNTFTVDWELLNAYLTSQEGKSLGQVKWVHNHPPSITGCSSVNLSPTIQDYNLYISLLAYLKTFDPSAELIGKVISDLGEFEFSVENPQQHYVSFDERGHPTGYLNINSFWIDNFDQVRSNNQTTFAEIQSMLAYQGLILNLETLETICE